MAKNKQHSLHEIIQSMDSPEKAYFKKFAFKRDNKNNASFIALFDSVDKQKQFDIEDLKKNKKLNSSHRANIHSALNALFKIICQVLIEYRKDKGNNQKLFHMLAEFDLFNEKKLFKLASKKCLQMEQFIEENNMYHFAPYVYQLRGSELQNNTRSSAEQLDVYFSKLDKSKRNLEINIDINKLSLKIEQVFHENGGVVKKNKTNLAQADKLLQFTDETMEKAKHNFLFTSVLANNRFIIQMIFGRFENIEAHMLSYFKYFDDNINHPIKDNALGDILITIKNFAVVSTYLNIQNVFIQARERLKIVQKKYKKETAKSKLEFRLDHLSILNFALNGVKSPQLDKVDEFLNAMEKMFTNKAQYSEAILSCMMGLVRVGKLDKALEISDNFVRSQHNERVRDQYISVRLLRAIIWFKQEIFELYDSEINSIYRKLLSTDNFPFQLHIVKELKKMNAVNSNKSNQVHIDKIVEECNEVLKKDTGSQMMKAIELKAIALLAFS